MKDKSLKFYSCNRGGCGSIVQRAVDFFGWIVPGAILVLIPKCPMCLAAYIALWTGIGLSISVAIYLRVSVLVLCVGVILFLAARSAGLLIYEFGRHEQLNREKCAMWGRVPSRRRNKFRGNIFP
jgi:hypothetical protein